MGQVPEFGIVGDGRVARHFLHYFDLLGIPVGAWARRSSTLSPPETLEACRTILLLIRDEAILPFVQAWPSFRTKRLVHFSGCLVAQVAEAAHPLMAFGPDLYDLASYRAIPFVLDEGGTPFADLLPRLPNPSFTIPVAQRPYYHALAVMAGNFSTLLWQKLFDEFEGRFGIPASAAHPYVARVAASLMANPGRALTGPLARQDVETIAGNLRALEGDPFRDVYAAFVRAHEDRA